jgi:threonine/homoserine/homoserine lactone efflux protein
MTVDTSFLVSLGISAPITVTPGPDTALTISKRTGVAESG